MKNKKILCYSPYNAWVLHGLYEITILQSLKLRGAEIKHILCDGAYTECDIHWLATNPRTEYSCLNCKSVTSSLSNELGLEFEGISKYFKNEEYNIIKRFCSTLTLDNILNAKFKNWNIGEWVLSSVHSHFRINSIDLNNILIKNTYIKYIESGLKAAFGIERLIKIFKPDILFLFNGRQSTLRVAYEVAKIHKIDSYMHERGKRINTLNIYKNIANDYEYQRYSKQRWRLWKNIDLNFDEKNLISNYMHGMSNGKGLNWKSYNSDNKIGLNDTLTKLKLKSTSNWLLFPSSMDEVIAAPHKKIFKDQREWIIRTINIANKFNKNLIIRIHPNTGSKVSTGCNHDEIDMFKEISRDYESDNIKFIWPSDCLNTYDLLNIADVGITHGSTIGLEMACMGKKVIVCAESFYDDQNFVWTLRNKNFYEDLLINTTKLNDGDYVKNNALKFAYFYYYRATFDFPLISMPNPHEGKLEYDSIASLLPGNDKQLDKVCDIILNNKDTIPGP